MFVKLIESDAESQHSVCQKCVAEKQGVKNVNRWCTKKVNQLQENFTVSQKQQNTTTSK